MTALAAPARRSANAAAAAEIVDAVHGVMKTILHFAQPALGTAGISMSQFWTLHMVSSMDSPSVGTLSRCLAVSAPSASANLDQLEAAGLLVRRRSAKDRRAVEIEMTPKGRKLESRVWAEIARLMAEASADLPPEDVQTAARVFRAVRKELERWPTPPEVSA